MNAPETNRLLIQNYYGANWFTDRGVRAKRKLIEKKGLPNLSRCLFITLTIPEGVCSPRKAYEKGKAKLRRFIAAIRTNFNNGKPFAWAWKLEFQENGMPHWHLIVDFRKHIPQEFLFHFEDWWGLGRVNVKRLKQSEFVYLFKYVSKEVAADVDPETGIALPSWVLDYKKTLKDGRVSAGIRFWQTGGNFYMNVREGENEAAEHVPPQTSRVPYTIRQRWSMWMRKATLCIKDEEGRYRFSRQISFTQPYHVINALVVQLLLNGKAAAVPEYHGWSCRLSEISKLICKTKQNSLLLAQQTIQQIQFMRTGFLSNPETVLFSAA